MSWVLGLVRITWMRRFYQVPTTYILTRNKKKNHPIMILILPYLKLCWNGVNVVMNSFSWSRVISSFVQPVSYIWNPLWRYLCLWLWDRERVISSASFFAYWRNFILGQIFPFSQLVRWRNYLCLSYLKLQSEKKLYLWYGTKEGSDPS